MEFVKCFLVFLMLTIQLVKGINIKIGVLYDTSTKSLAEQVEIAVAKYTTPDTTVNTTKISINQHQNLSDVVSNENFTALISVASKLECGNLTAIKKLIPIYSIARTLHSCETGQSEKSISYLFPPSSSLISAITTSANLYGWSKAIVFEEESKEMQFSFSDMQYAREYGIEIIAYKANGDEESLIRTMKLARKEGVRAYILSSPAVSALSIMEIAQKKQLATSNFHWFLPNVFIDPDRFLDLARSGVRMSFLSSAVITPLVRGLMTRYASEGAGLNVTSDVMYNDVIASLAGLVVEKLAKACGDGKCGIVDNTGKPQCGPWEGDVQLAAPTTASRYLKKRALSDVETRPPNNDVCELDMHRSTPCKRISKILAQGEPFTSVEERKHMVKVETIDTLMARGATKDRRRSKRNSPRATQETFKCPVFEWPESMTQHITGSAASVSTLSLQYESTSNFCSNFTASEYQWSYKDGSCSKNFLTAAEITHSGSIFITELTPADKELPREVVIAGIFDGRRSLLNVSYNPFSITDLKLPRRPLLVCAIWQPPWLSWKMNEETQNLEFEGYLYEVLEYIGRSMNFSFEMVMNQEFNSGHRLTEDELERSMYNSFENDSCDFFLHTKSIRGGRMGRAETVDLSLALQQPSMFLLTKRLEKAESIDIWQFMTPFHEESWIYLWSSYILVSLFLAWINTKNPYEYQKISASFGPDSEPSDHLGVLNSLWFNFSSIVQQGVDIVPRSKAGKMLTGVWWFFGLTIITAYTANMTLFMTQVNKGGIETLDELAGQKEFAYGIMHDNPMLTLFLPDAKERPYTLLYNYLKKEWNNSVFNSHQQAFDRILAGNFYLMSSFATAVEALTTSCEFDKVGTGFYKYQFGLPFPKGSLLIPIFNDHIAQLRDRGILSMLEEKWFSLETKCENTNVAKTLENQLDIKAFTGMYVFLIIGCSIGIFICISEIAWVRFGGVTGMAGKARKYEFEENRRENRKTLKKLEEEFEKWEGGWEVWKFKEWSNHGNPNDMKEDKRNAMLAQKIRETTLKHAQQSCELCGKTMQPKTGQAAAYRSNIITKDGRTPDSGRSSAASGLSVTEEGKMDITAEKKEKMELKEKENVPSDALEKSPVPLPMITQEIPVKNHEPPQTTTRADVLREKFSLCNVSSVQSHSSLASGPLSIPGISASDWTVSTKLGDSVYDVTIEPPSDFSMSGYHHNDDDHYYEITSSGRSSSYYEDSSFTEEGDYPDVE